MNSLPERNSRARVLLLAAWIVLGAALPNAGAYRDDDYHDRHQHKSYVFAATRGLSEMDVSPLLKIPAFPVTIILDIVALPVTLIADAVSD